MSNRENLIDKVRKLRALEHGAGTVQEAATAARLAEKIIQEHSLAEAELEISLGSQEAAGYDGIPIEEFGQRQTNWKNILITGLCTAYNCSGAMDRNKSGNLIYLAIGRPSDVSLIRFQYAFFTIELTRLSHSLAPRTLGRGSGKNWHNSFYLGAVNAIISSLNAAKKDVQTNATSSALLVINKHIQEANALKNRMFPNTRTKNVGSNINYDAYQTGKQAGSNIRQHQAIGNGVKGLLGS